MRSIRIRSIVGSLLVGTAVVALLASGAFAELRTVISLSDYINNWGWIGGKATVGGKAPNLSYKNSAARGQAGPAPTGTMQFDTGEISTGPCGAQSWAGTDEYNGVAISDLKKLTYWTILEMRGATKHLCDNGENYVHEPDPGWWNDGQYVCHGPPDEQYPLGHPVLNTDHETQPWFWNYQPPQIELCITLVDLRQRTLTFKPWGMYGASKPDSDHGKWQKWDCLADNAVWTDSMGGCSTGYPGILPDGTPGPSRWHYWYQIVEHYPGAIIATAPLADGVWGNAGNPLQTGFSLALGSRATSLPWTYAKRPDDWDVADDYYSAAYYESYNAKGDVDLLDIEYDSDPSEEVETLVEHIYDFQSNYKNAGIIPPSAPTCLNIKAVYDQAVYEPAKGAVGTHPYPIDNSLMNAVQRAGYYCVRGPEGGGLKGNQFVVYGLVKDVSGDTFHVDDGSGVLLPCYLYQGFYSDTESVQVGQYLRMEGSFWGNNPGYWPYLNIRWTRWEPDPALRDQYLTHLKPWRFDTYPGKVTVLNEQ